MAIVESNPNIIYAAYFESNTLAVYKTQDFGQNWNLILTKSINDPSSLNYADLSVSKSGQYILVNHSILSTNPQIFFSNNYGLSWQNIYMPSYSIDNNTQIKEYHDAIVHDSGVFCIRRTGGDFTISKPPVCSFDEGSTFVEQTSATGTNMGYLLVGSRGFNAKNNIFVLSGMLGWFSTTGGYVYIGTCNP